MKRRMMTVLLGFAFAALMLCGCSREGSAQKNETAYSRESADYLPGYAGTVSEDAKVPEYTADTSGEVNLLDNSKIVYTASLRAETVEFDQAYQAMNDLVAETGGYMERCSLSKNGAYRRVDAVIRIPAERYQEFIERGSSFGQMLSLNEEKQDVTSSYYDIESRLKTAKVKLERLQELMKQADYMGDLIELSNAISDAEYEIDYLQGNLNHLDARVSYSTVNSTLSEVKELCGVEKPQESFWEKFGNAWATGAKNALGFFRRLAIDFAEHFLGWLILIGVVIAGIIVGKRLVRKAKRGEAKEPKQTVTDAAGTPEKTENGLPEEPGNGKTGNGDKS